MYHRQIAGPLMVLVAGLIAGGCDQGGGGGQPSPSPVPPPEAPPSPPPPTALPDLVLVGGRVEPSGMVAPGTTVRFILEVRNQGSGPTPPGFIAVGGAASGGVPGPLAPGESRAVTLQLTAHSPNATYDATFIVDPDNVIQESNEGNNGSQTLTVRTTF